MNFDRLAPHYGWLEAVTAGARLERARTAMLDGLDGRQAILSAGEGHGRFAAACTRRFPRAQLTCIDSSAAMLAQARRHLGPAARRIHWHHTDVRRWTPGRQAYDALATCFFLDCFPPGQLAAVIDRLQGAAAADAAWLVVDFAVPAAGLAHWRARALHRIMYAFFRRATRLEARALTPPDALLIGHGFRLEQRRELEWGLLRADLWVRRAQA